LGDQGAKGRAKGRIAGYVPREQRSSDTGGNCLDLLINGGDVLVWKISGFIINNDYYPALAVPAFFAKLAKKRNVFLLVNFGCWILH
jgi:hypothetical protein